MDSSRNKLRRAGKVVGAFVGVFLLYPFPASAQALCRSGFDNITQLFTWGTCLLSKAIIPFLGGLALMVFIWGIIQFVANADDETKRAAGRQSMLWGIIGLFVMFAIWGILQVLSNTFGISMALPQF